ncbi:YceI family protein [Tunicatimonas pelagia]|uniref:YceI family protein n=1 Tax=Tunicatimonas pelagia TaxID=931531 RepID=UPI00266612AC|nr:YceI family protein [Tunicatimonas pelagia]WKN43846.1 YceI family protein [Tunicatimonas pelagia]
MKNIIIIYLAFLVSNSLVAQDKFITQTGHTKFFSSAPLEDIEAHNNKVQSVIDFAKQEVVVSMDMQAFEFDKSLMREHFNENYVESEKYPKAIFKGTFSNGSPIDPTKDGAYTVTVEGTMTIHGVTQPVTTEGTIVINGAKVNAQTKFMIKVADHDIDIPKIVFHNIAEEVEVTVDLKYDPLNS